METATLTRAEEREAAQMTRFFERVRMGCGPLNAAIEVGWSPRGLEKRTKDPDFADMLAVARERLLEDIEETVIAKARQGNVKCIQMVLYNQRADRWKDVRHIKMESSGQLDQTVVLSVKQAMVELLRDRGSVAALQPAPVALEAIDVDSR